MFRAPVVIASLVLISAPALRAAEHVWSTERRLTVPAQASAGGQPLVVSAAANGDEALVAWTNRGGAYVTRFDGGATAGSAERLPIGGRPALAAAGQRFLAVWKESGRLFAMDVSRRDRVDLGALGEVEDIAAFEGSGGAALVVTADWSSDRLRARLLGPEATPDSGWIDLGRVGSPDARGLALAADSRGFLLLNLEQLNTSPVTQSVHGRRITAAGIAADFRIETSRQPVTAIHAAWDGSRFVLLLQNSAWADGPLGSRALLLGRDGSVQGEFQVGPAGTEVTDVVRRPGGSLAFLYGSGGRSSAIVLDHERAAAGSPVDLGPLPPAAAVPIGDRVLIAWTEWEPYGPRSFARWLDAESGNPRSRPFVVSRGTADQSRPAVALGDPVDLVVWEELDAERRIPAVRGARIRPDGSVVDPTPLRISPPGPAAVDPAVAFDGTQFVVVWAEAHPGAITGRLLARRVRTDGAFGDADPIVVSTELSATPSVAQIGRTTFVAWVGARIPQEGSLREVLGARIAPNGTLVDSPPLRISNDAWVHYAPEVVAGSDAFLVGWQTYRWAGGRTPVSTGSSVALVTPGGTVHAAVDLQPLAENVGASGPQLAWNGSEFLAAWSARRTVLATTVTPGGTRGPQIQLPVGRLAELGWFEGSWHLVLGAAGDEYGAAGAAMNGAYFSPALRMELMLPRIPGGDGPVSAPAIASSGSRAVLAYRRVVLDPPMNGSGEIVFRRYDAPATCCDPPLRHRGVRH